MKMTNLPIKILIILAGALFLLSCNPLEKDTLSNSLLLVDSITGLDIEGNIGNFLQSDVAIIDEETGSSTIRADIATATLRVTTLDPNPILGTSQYSDVMVTRYVVTYIRSDGRNTPGQDVPYPFEGSLSVLIQAGTTEEISFVIVREVAKIEPPLVQLTRSGDVLQVSAKVDFYGHDLVNNTVKATGYLTIFFANYANE
jgi:hypothetical protein